MLHDGTGGLIAGAFSSPRSGSCWRAPPRRSSSNALAPMPVHRLAAGALRPLPVFSSSRGLTPGLAFCLQPVTSGRSPPRRAIAPRRAIQVAKTIIITTATRTTTAATSGYFKARNRSETTNTSSATAEDPVGERLGAGVGGRARAGLGEVRSGGERAAQQTDQVVVIGLASPSVLMAISAPPTRTNRRVHDVPDRIDPRDLVGDELDHAQPSAAPMIQSLSKTRYCSGSATQP